METSTANRFQSCGDFFVCWSECVCVRVEVVVQIFSKCIPLLCKFFKCNGYAWHPFVLKTSECSVLAFDGDSTYACRRANQRRGQRKHSRRSGKVLGRVQCQTVGVLHRSGLSRFVQSFNMRYAGEMSWSTTGMHRAVLWLIPDCKA